MENNFILKDSGERVQFESGMVRDVSTNKINWALVADGPMFARWADHLTKGAKKYTARNWMQASGLAEYTRFRESAFRHFIQWYYGETDEDHASATFFNINGAEYVKEQIEHNTSISVGSDLEANESITQYLLRKGILDDPRNL